MHNVYSNIMGNAFSIFFSILGLVCFQARRQMHSRTEKQTNATASHVHFMMFSFHSNNSASEGILKALITFSDYLQKRKTSENCSPTHNVFGKYCRKKKLNFVM